MSENYVVLPLSGRVDSSNAAQVEQALLTQRSAQPEGALELNLSGLEYISSAGLRVLLKLKKQEPDMVLTNVSSEVYEILEMTGFSEILTVRKAMRQLSVEGCPVIGEGGFGIVYRLDADTILKVYKQVGVAPEIVERELTAAKQAFLAGIPTAISYDIVRVEDKLGVVYEMLDAKQLADCIMDDPEHEQLWTDRFIDLAKQIHRTDASAMGIPDARDVLRSRVALQKSRITPEQENALLQLIDAIPASDRMIHGDFHPKNIMVQGEELMLIDMGDMCMGHPIVDIMNCYLALYNIPRTRPELMLSKLGVSGEVAGRMWDRFMERYFAGVSAENKEAITQLCASLCTLKLCVFIPNLDYLTPYFLQVLGQVLEQAEESKRLLGILDSMGIW